MQDLLDGEFDSPPSPPICYLYRSINLLRWKHLSLIKFAHASDLHLGAPFSGISKTEDSDIKDKLVNATYLAYDNLISKCIDNDVDALILSGDIFDLADHNYLAQQKFKQGVEKLDSFSIKVFACRGNHDPLDGWDPKLLMPKNYKEFGPKVESFPVFEDEPNKVVVHGVSYPTREVLVNLVEKEFSQSKINKKFFNIGVLHANVGNNSEHAQYSPCSISDLSNTGHDYWALGHIHKRQTLKERNPAIVYSGNTQSRHRNEPGEKGFYIIDVDENKEINMRFETVDVVRFVDLSVSIQGAQSIESLYRKIDELIMSQYRKSSSIDLVLNIIITGAGVIHEDFAKGRYKKEEILQIINENWANKTPFVWCGNLILETSREINREELKKRDDFVGNFLLEVDIWKNSPQKQEDILKIIQEELYKNSKFSKYLAGSFFKDLNIEELIDHADRLSLSKLLREAPDED